jgi:hypothetical protein
MYDPRKAIEE